MSFQSSQVRAELCDQVLAQLSFCTHLEEHILYWNIPFQIYLEKFYFYVFLAAVYTRVS